MVIICTLGWQVKETAFEAVPASLFAIMVKLAVPVKLMLETVRLRPEKSNGIGILSCKTEIPSSLTTFSIIALMEALQFSTVTLGEVGDVILIVGGFRVGSSGVTGSTGVLRG